MKKKLYKAIAWFIETISGKGLDCEESEFIRSILTSIFVNMLEDGTMIWDSDMVESAYPQAIDQIKRREHERVINELILFITSGELNRRINNGK